MHRNRAALAVLVISGLVATGCGSDDDPEPESGGQSDAAQVDNGEPKPKPKAKKGVRAQMVQCIEDELGFEVSPGDDNPDKLSVNKPDGGKRQVVIVIHDNAAAAGKAVERTLGGGRNAVVIGRAELIRYGAGDTDTGVIANCVQAGYNRP